MNKSELTQFISLYSLGGLVSSVKWSVKGNVLSTTFAAEDRSMAGTINHANFTFEDCEFGIFNTEKFSAYLKVLEDEIEMALAKNDAGKPTALEFKDKSGTEISAMLSEPSVIPPAPKVKAIDAFNVEIPIDQVFISKYVRAKSALPDVDSVTFAMNKKGDKLEMIIGWAERSASDRIKVEVKPIAGKDVLSRVMSFNADYLREILAKNSTATGAMLKIAEKGIAELAFSTPDFQSTYFLIEKKLKN